MKPSKAFGAIEVAVRPHKRSSSDLRARDMKEKLDICIGKGGSSKYSNELVKLIKPF